MLTEVTRCREFDMYCGPTCIAACTGESELTVLGAIRLVCDKPRGPIVGMSTFDLCNVLGYLGYGAHLFHINPKPPFKRPTMFGYFKTWEPTLPVVAVFKRHFVATDGIEALCNQTAGKPVCMLAHPYLRRTIHSVCYVRKL